MGRIIGVCNQKGGTAKTTTSINLSAFLGSAGKKTLLIDMDPQGNATSGVGFNLSEEKNSIYDILMRGVFIKETIYPTLWPNLFIIPSDISLSGGEIELVNTDNRETRLKTAIDNIKEEFEYIIIDAPPSLGLLTVNVLVAADSLVIPIQCEYYALEGVSKLTHTIDLIKERINPRLEIEGVLLTMADFRTRLTLQVIDEVKRFFKEKAFNTIIPRNVKLAEAPSFGKPINFYDQLCTGAKVYFNLAQEIMREEINFFDERNREELLQNIE